MDLGFWAGLTLLVLFVGGATWFFFQVRKAVREDEQQKYKQRQTAAREADQERANEIAEKADEAARPRDHADPLADRLRGSGRGRTTQK